MGTNFVPIVPESTVLGICRHDLHVWYHNALSFLSLQCREKKEKESEPKLWLTDQIQSAAIHQYTFIAHTHDCSCARRPVSLIRNAQGLTLP